MNKSTFVFGVILGSVITLLFLAYMHREDQELKEGSGLELDDFMDDIKKEIHNGLKRFKTHVDFGKYQRVVNRVINKLSDKYDFDMDKLDDLRYILEEKWEDICHLFEIKTKK